MQDVASPAPAPAGPLLRALEAVPEERLLAVLLAASLAFTVAAAVASDSVFQIDEHFQVVEYAGHKLGRTPASELPWEFAARIRPWLQPGAYYLLARGLGAVGVQDPFALARAFRLASGLLSWGALAALLLAVRHWFPAGRWRRAAFLSLALPYFVPYLAARVSSESLSTTFLVLGLAALAAPGAGSAGGPSAVPARHLAAGLALGLSFSFRFQAGVAVAGILAWVLFRERDRWGKLLWLGLGLALPLAIAPWVDAWGYGTLELVPWNYFRANLVEGKAASFGTTPVFAYLGMLAALFPPFGLVLMAGMLLFWWRFPGHLLTWATLPFFAVHSLIAHKEIRFLFPILPAATLCLVLLWAAPAPVRPWEGKLLSGLRVLWFGRVTWALNAVALLLLCVLPSSDNLGLQRYFHDHAGEPARWVALSDPRRFHGANVPFLWPRPMPAVEVVRDAAELQSALDAGPVPVLVTAKHPLPPGTEEMLSRRGTRVFTSLPSWLARLNLFHWVDRADMTYVWRVEQ
jgi:phosphatidylinositol glycan class B